MKMNSITDSAIAAVTPVSRGRISHRRRRQRVPRAALLLAPSFLLVAIFVYVFIAYTIGVAITSGVS